MIDFVYPQTMVIVFSYVLTSNVIEFNGLREEAVDKIVGCVLGQLFNRVSLTLCEDVSRKHEKARCVKCLWLPFVQFTIVLCTNQHIGQLIFVASIHKYRHLFTMKGLTFTVSFFDLFSCFLWLRLRLYTNIHDSNNLIRVVI